MEQSTEELLDTWHLYFQISVFNDLKQLFPFQNGY